VTPRGYYAIHGIENSSNCANIEPGKAVFLIGFCESEIGPHMGNDNRYYIRAGAHTDPASHFIVEAIHARRGLRTPLLRHIVRYKPGNSDVIQLGIVALNAAPAIDVSIETGALPDLVTPHLEEGVSLQVPIISEQFPLFFDVCTVILDEQKFPPFQVELTYSDLANRTYRESFEVDIELHLGPNLSSDKGTDSIVQQLKDIAKVIKTLKK
jgi:hypothetical protein